MLFFFLFLLFCLLLLIHNQARVVSDVDTHLIAPMFGYSSLDDYYNDSRNRDKVHRIKTPLVCIAAADDPFVPKECKITNNDYFTAFIRIVISEHYKDKMIGSGRGNMCHLCLLLL